MAKVVQTTTFGEATMKTLSAAEANRRFSAVLRGVSGGESYQVTSRGKPVAVITPIAADSRERRASRRALLKRLQAQPISAARNWTRAELYD